VQERKESRGPDPHPAGNRAGHRKGHQRVDDPAIDVRPRTITVFTQSVDAGLILGIENALEDPKAVVPDLLGQFCGRIVPSLSAIPWSFHYLLSRSRSRSRA
jgi:hypothetical protein